MKIYLLRSVKYLIWLTILFFVIFTLMLSTGASEGNVSESFNLLFNSNRGLFMLVMVLFLAAFYPKFGFTKREVKATISGDRDEIIKAFEMSGYKLIDESASELIFKSASFFKSFLLLWEDKIEVTADDNYISFEGSRKEVIKIDFRLKAILGQKAQE